MWLVVASLVPALVVALYTFGLSALTVTVVCILSCMLTELAIDRIMGRRSTLSDGSALLTGLLLAFNLPSILPWWMAAIYGIRLLWGECFCSCRFLLP